MYDIAITVDRDRWLLDSHGDHLVIYLKAELFCGKSETNMILYVNYYSIIKKENSLTAFHLSHFLGVCNEQP